MMKVSYSQRKPEYFRSDIEGLRAIAILLVIGAHFAIPGLSAGFIGVDVFFVISGYLITGILVREKLEHTRINLPRFYANRFRRLFPALATMLVISSIAAYWILPETQNLANSNAAAMAAVWLSNVHFTFSDTNYFSAEVNNNIFLHTWSLGVEEQFYLIWPIIILLAASLFDIHKKFRNLLWVLFIVAITSFFACLHIAQLNPTFSFYMMPTRAWQFAAGAMTWVLVQRKASTIKSSNLLAIYGLALIFSSLVLIRPDTAYPGVWALLPTFATCVWLCAGSKKGSLYHTILSLPPLQWIGRLSYSWYLWHWPVLVLGDHLTPIRGHLTSTIGAIGLSLLLAITTHRLIENPIRFGKTKLLPSRWQLGVTLVFMVLINSQLLRWHTQTQQFLVNSSSPYLHAASDLPFFYQDDCDDWYQSDELKPCIYGSERASRTAVLLGDSIGSQWFPLLTKIFNENEWKLIVLTKSSCPMVDEPFFYQRIGREYTECANWRGEAIAWIKSIKPDIVFMGSTASNPFSDQQWLQGSSRILSQLSSAAEQVYLIEANPVLGFNGPSCLLQYHRNSPEKCAHGRADNSVYRHVAKLLEATTLEYGNTYWLETASFVCPNGQCSAERDGLVVFRDSQHLTASFTISAAEHFRQQMKLKSE